MAISPTDRFQWTMENALLVGTVLVLAFTYGKFRFSNLSYLLIAVFLCFHTYGAHYTYQNTPFDAWLKASIHTQRSYYDRVVHFAFGLLMAYPFRDALTRLKTLNNRGFLSYFIPAALILSAGAVFEIIEMIAALAAGQAGQDYAGLQGDPFDSEKDMALSSVGGIIAVLTLAAIHKSMRTKESD